MKENSRLILTYIGIPIIGVVLFLLQYGKIDNFILLQLEIIMIFGYIGSKFDLKSKFIPNELILSMIGVWVITMVTKLFLDIDTGLTILIDSSFGFLIGGGLFLLVYIISRKGLGGGDVKFMAATGLYTGFSGIIAVMLYGTLLAAITGLLLMLLKKIGRKDTMPLVPFLYMGILLVIFFR